MTIANIGGINQVSVEPGYRMDSEEIPIPGGTSQAFAVGASAPDFTITGQIVESTIAASKNKWLQLVELCSNRNYFPLYIQFAANESVLDGWYEVLSIGSMTRNKETFSKYPFQIYARRTGTLGSHRLATQWTAAAEVYSWGGATLTAKRLISIPYNVALVGETVLETRATNDGSVQVIEDPANPVILYQSSTTISDWFKSECRVWDGDPDAGGVQVFSKDHVFSNNYYIENGLFRYRHDNAISTEWATLLYVWASADSTPAWKSLGIFSSGSAVKHFEITKISPDEICWRIIAQSPAPTTHPEVLLFSLRRGMRALKITVTTTTGTLPEDAGIYFPSIAEDTLFNASATGLVGAGNLATDANNNYHSCYDAGATVKKYQYGFILLDKPSFQPVDDPLLIAESNAWTTNQTRSFFIHYVPQETNPFVLADGRTNAAKIARQCMYAVDQKLILMPKGRLN